MKKLLLSFVFILGIGTMINAESSSYAYVTDCGEMAFNLQGDLEGAGLEMEKANEVATLVYDICVSAGGHTNGN